MSIILNALRKSEQERQQRQTLSLNDKILPRPEVKQKHTSIWLIVLVIVNLIFLSYLFWIFVLQNDDITVNDQIAENKHQLAPNLPEINRNQAINLTKAENQPVPEQLKKPVNIPAVKSLEKASLQGTTSDPELKKETKQPVNKTKDSEIKNSEEIKNINTLAVNLDKTNEPLSIEKQFNKIHNNTKTTLDKQKVSQIKTAKSMQIAKSNQSEDKKTTMAKPESMIPTGKKTGSDTIKLARQQVLKKPLVKSLKQQEVVVKQADDQHIHSNTNDNQQEKVSKKRQLEQTTSKLKKPVFEDQLLPKPEIKPVFIRNQNKTSKLQWLSELPYEFRRTVPDLKINVYVYSEEKKNRFIMINMAKYVSGHDIGEGMILKEIRMNSLVVKYNNKMFKIKRK